MLSLLNNVCANIMNLKIIVKSKNGKTGVEKNPTLDFDYIVYINVPREKGRANKEVIHLLAEELNVSASNITIKRGFTSSKKVVEITGN